MGMGYGACNAIVVDTDKLKEMNLSSYYLLMNALNKYDVSFEEFARAISLDDDILVLDEAGDQEVLCEDMTQDLLELYKALGLEFEKETGLHIYLIYHNSADNGDRYDEIDGAVWGLDFHDVYKMTPEAEALKNRLPFETQWFVEYG